MEPLHSEYRSTYRWHEYTGPRPRQDDVIRGQPPPSGGPGPAPEPEATRLRPPGGARRVAHEDHLRADAPDNSEPILPRRRKHPLLAYRCHEVLGLTAAASEDCLDSARSDRFRSRSAPRRTAAKMVAVGGLAGEPSADLPAAGLPTERQSAHEYRRQFGGRPGGSAAPAAPAAPAARMEAAVHSALLAAQRPAAGKLSGAPQSAHQPRKSLSMGALRAQQQQQRSRATDQDRTDDAGESEPLMASQDHGDADDMRGEEKIREDNIGKEDKPRYRKEFKTEYKKKFRPFSQYEYVEGRFMKRREEEAAAVTADPEPPPPPQPQQPWYAEVIELRKKAGEYKHRGWGTELAPEHIAELYSKQMLVWEQVSRRSSLSALSLAAVASPRSISKEEKERENSRRTSPTKAASVQSQPQGRPRPHTAQPKLPGVHERSKSEKARKTEKADDNKKEAGPRSSRKEFPLRHHLERTTGAGRSQSLGPGGGAAAETRSPKRTPRPPSTASAAPAERRPRPTTLNTTAPSRSKSRTSASAPSKGEHQAHKSQPSAGRAASSGTVRGDDKKAVPPKARARPARERLHATPSPAPPAKAPEPTEAEPVLSPSPVPTDTPSPRSPLSPELGSRIASPATLEVMSICQNGGQEGSPPTPADTRPHSPGCADVAVGPAAPAEPTGVLEAAQDTPSPGAGEIGLRDGATSNGPAAENGSETLDDLSALNGRNGENSPTSHTASNGLATEIPNGLNGLNGQHRPPASPTASVGLGTEISNGLNATSVENGHKSVNGLNGSAAASPEPLPAPGNTMTSEIDFFGDLDLGPPPAPAPVAKTKADPFSLLCDLDDTVADPTQPSPADDKKGVPLHEDDLFGPSLTF